MFRHAQGREAELIDTMAIGREESAAGTCAVSQSLHFVMPSVANVTATLVHERNDEGIGSFESSSVELLTSKDRSWSQDDVE